jgi:hypothetical protein
VAEVDYQRLSRHGAPAGRPSIGKEAPLADANRQRGHRYDSEFRAKLWQRKGTI